jgi:hypothetical protein
LVTGSIHDQTGTAIAGAQVQAVLPDGSVASARSGPDGTFALRAQSVQHVRISCWYCRSAEFSVADDGTVVAIIRRYSALLSETPSAADIASVPYAHIESDLTLQPFQELANAHGIFPGPQVSDHGVQQGGGLVFDAGIANYDMVTNTSPFITIPQHYIQSAAIYPQSDSFRYGDVAASGTYVLNPEDDGADATALVGSDGVFRLGGTSPTAAGSVGYSADSQEQRRRLDARFRQALGGGELTATLTAGGGLAAPTSNMLINANFSGVQVAFEQTRAFNLRFDGYADRGMYGASYLGQPLSADWSDVGGNVTMSSNATIAPFTTFGVRSSFGSYTATQFGVAPIAASLAQAQAVAGVQAHGDGYQVLAGVGDYAASFSGGSYQNTGKPGTQLATPVLRVTLAPEGRWSLEASDSGGFRLPTLLQLFGAPASQTLLVIDRYATVEGTLSYTDGSRVRVDFTTLARKTSGPDAGTTDSVGGSVAWQVAPLLSLRGWLMRVSPQLTTPGTAAIPFPPTDVGSLWLTYANNNNLRVDAIWRQDLLDDSTDAHLDASISGPLSSRLRWFVATERRLGVRYANAGIRLNVP